MGDYKASHYKASQGGGRMKVMKVWFWQHARLLSALGIVAFMVFVFCLPWILGGMGVDISGGGSP
jgi:hypothetical protein